MNNCRLTAETDFEGFCDNPHPHPKKGIHLGRTSSKKTLKIVVRMLSTIDGYRRRVGKDSLFFKGLATGSLSTL